MQDFINFLPIVNFILLIVIITKLGSIQKELRHIAMGVEIALIGLKEVFNVIVEGNEEDGE